MPSQPLYQIKQLSGILNTDDPLDSFPPHHHRDSRNIRFRNGRPENIPGNIEIPFNPPIGTNENVGGFYDGVKQRIIFMNWNSNGTDGIYKYDLNTKVVSSLLVCGTNSTGNILNFDLDNFIADIDILYTNDETGDVLHWVQRNTEARQLNIKQAEDNVYGANWMQEYLNVIKRPPQMPAKVVYENDTTITGNNVRNELLQFGQIFHYDDNEKSVVSTRSIVPLPFQNSVSLTSDTFTNNSRISVSVSTGGANVKKFSLCFREFKDGTTSDWLLIDVFDKDDLSIADNDIYTYKFYNSGLYSNLDDSITDSTQLQSYVQREPKSQALLNGNVLELAGGIEGYDYVNSDMDINTQAFSASSFFYDYNGNLFFATINGLDSGSVGTTMKIYLYGTGTNTAGKVTTLNNGAAYYVINCVDGAGTTKGVSYLNSTDNPTVASVLAAVSALLVINGFTQVSIVDNILTVTYPTDITLYSSGTKTTGTGNSSPTNLATTHFTYPWQSAYTYAAEYFSDEARTNGATISLGSSAILPVDNGGNMTPQVQINHRPPLWAKSFQLLRSKNNTYNFLRNWITNGAYADAQANIMGLRYAYLEYDNMLEYNKSIESTSGIVNYSFTKGDRVRIYGRWDATGTAATFSTIYDYEILGTTESVILTNAGSGSNIVLSNTKIGNFIKILYPTADIGANFKFDGTPDFMLYTILIYNYAAHESVDKQPYFEFGKCFGIGNAGTINAYHIGLEQSQTADLVTPALISVANGDYFGRNRKVPTGQTFLYSAGGTDQDITATLLITVPTVVNNSSYKIQSQPENSADPFSPGVYPQFSDTDNFFTNNSATLDRTIRVKATITVFNNNNENSVFNFGVSISTATTKIYTVLSFPHDYFIPAGQIYTTTIDTYVTVPPTGKLWFIVEDDTPSSGDHFVINKFDLTIEVINNITIPIVESSFSDNYNIVCSSNGRPSIVDENAKEGENPVLIRWSLPRQEDTSINGINNFTFLNYDVVDASAGAIQRTLYFKKRLIVLQETKSGRYGVYSKYIKNNSGTTDLVVTDEILTKNNIQYYESGEYGLGKQYTAMCHSENSVYFVSPITGSLLRIAQDGITNLSELYKGQYFLSNLMNVYNNTYLRANGSKAKIMLFFDNFEEQAMIILQGGTKDGIIAPDESFSFNENRNGFCTFYDYINPDNMMSAQNTTFAFKSGRFYSHTDEEKRCSFFGIQYDASITPVYNEQVAIKKKFNHLSYQSNKIWVASDLDAFINGQNVDAIVTSFLNPQTGFQQTSKLKDFNFEVFEGLTTAALLRDINSSKNPMEGLYEGDYLEGFWLKIKFTYRGSDFSYIYLPTIGWEVSNRNL